MSNAPCNTGRRGDEINYGQSKKNFMKLVEHKLGKHKRHQLIYELHTKRRIDQIIAQKLEHPLFHPKYEVLCKDGRNILVTKRKTTNSYIQILSWEDIFDTFMPLHVRTGHRGAGNMKKVLHLYTMNNDIEYKFPVMCLNYFRRVCNLCVQNSGRYSLLKTLKTGIVHVIAMTPTCSGEWFRYLLIYADKETFYTILRPLREKTSLEISGELYKIFTQFGPPIVLHIHGYNSALTDKIRNTLHEICPEFKIEIEHQPGRYELPTIVTDRIQDWMKRTKSLAWEVGCYIIQAEMNNDPQMRPSGITNQPQCTPHALYFHTNIEQKQGVMSSTDTKTDNVIDLTSEENNQNLTAKDKQVKKDNQVDKDNQVSKDNQMSNDYQVSNDIIGHLVNQVSNNNQISNEVNQSDIFYHNQDITTANHVANIILKTVLKDQNRTEVISLIESDESQDDESDSDSSDSMDSENYLNSFFSSM